MKAHEDRFCRRLVTPPPPRGRSRTAERSYPQWYVVSASSTTGGWSPAAPAGAIEQMPTVRID